jgi:ACR3 family arsenite efflux pump ArsB
MLLELGKAVTFVLSLMALYPVLMSAFFDFNATWQQRLTAGLLRLVVAACVSFASGFVFAYPVAGNPETSVWRTMPVRVFLLAMLLFIVMFGVAWYVRCGALDPLRRDCYWRVRR